MEGNPANRKANDQYARRVGVAAAREIKAPRQIAASAKIRLVSPFQAPL
jgi:hypothetical protein